MPNVVAKYSMKTYLVPTDYDAEAWDDHTFYVDSAYQLDETLTQLHLRMWS